MTTAHKIDFDSIRHLLTPRAGNSHKGDFGHVLVIGGDKGFGGAALMAGISAARTGAGLVSVATHPAHCSAVLSRCPELMARGIEESEDLLDMLASASVIILGPGLGQTDWSRVCLRLTLEQLSESPVPLVLDADALNLVSEGLCKEVLTNLEDIIITPHPGEASRLLGCTSAEIQADRLAAITSLQQAFPGGAVLKGQGTLMAWRRENRTSVVQCAHGNPGMATGGMGDVLSGVLGGLLAQGFSLEETLQLGVCIHSKAADLVAASQGERGMLATDLIGTIHQLVNP